MYGIGFLISLVLCVYYGLSGAYIMTLLLLIVEIICLLYLIACFFPGGKDGVTHMLKAVWGLIKGLFRK